MHSAIIRLNRAFSLLTFYLYLSDKHQIISCGEDKYLRVMDLESGTEMFVKDVKDTVL